MAIGLALAYGQEGIQQQHALSGPAFQIAVSWRGEIDIGIIGQFLVNVSKRRRNLDAFANGKAKTMSLIWTVVGILPDNDDLNTVQWRPVETGKHIRGWRVNCCGFSERSITILLSVL